MKKITKEMLMNMKKGTKLFYPAQVRPDIFQRVMDNKERVIIHDVFDEVTISKPISFVIKVYLIE